MNAPVSEPRAPAETDFNRNSWSRARWVVYVLIAFALHLGLIFAFGNRKAVAPREVSNAPSVRMATARTELQTLDDPTLFALPHQRGFAGGSWLQPMPVAYPPFRWTEPPQLLELPVAQLGSVFLHFVQSNPPPRLELSALAPPEVTHVAGAGQPTALKQRSSVRLVGSLAQRRWLNAPAILRSWPATDVLTNSVVQVSFDADGQIFRASLVPPGSGSRPADQHALDLARAARFAPIARHSGPLTLGTMIFEWHAVPVPDTNAPAPPP